MYLLVLAGIIALEALKKQLKPYGYTPARTTQGLWMHKDRDINFSLVVDNSVIK